jgi:hypothetical protein
MRVSFWIPALVGAAVLVLTGSAFFAAEPAATPAKTAPPPSSQECPAPGPDQKAETKEPADNSYCYACHANYQEEKLSRVHEVVGVGCETCHGPSIKHSGDEDNLIPPDKMFPKSEIDAYCMTCHEKPKLLKREDHRDFFKKPAPGETCTNCHGEKHRLKVRTRVWDKKTRQLLKDDGVRMMEKRPK